MRLQVAVEVVRDEIIVSVVNNSGDEGRKGSFVAKSALLDRVEDLLEIGVDLVLAVVMCVAKFVNVLG